MDLEKYRRVSRALAESQRLNALLEERVREKQRELERQFETVQRLAREAAVAEERRRIMADMHDGIGASLISTLTLVEYGEASKAQVAVALRECIDDLRLAIDSLEPAEGDLAPVLGGLRYRLEPRLKAAGITLDWHVHDLPTLACLTPRNVLHVLRILQEAFTNVLKHAHASIVSVETGLDGVSGAFIRVRDNGKGFDGRHKGHGIDNMTRRARAIGARLDIRPSPAGTTLELLLPAT